MTKKIVLYGTVRPIVGQSFKDCKKLTVPSQSMSLREILTRFTRRESVPVEKQGLYMEGEGDLEKIAQMDVTEQLEVVESYKVRQKAYHDKVKADRDKAKAEGMPKPPPQPTPPTPTPAQHDPHNPSGEPKPQ